MRNICAKNRISVVGESSIMKSVLFMQKPRDVDISVDFVYQNALLKDSKE